MKPRVEGIPAVPCTSLHCITAGKAGHFIKAEAEGKAKAEADGKAKTEAEARMIVPDPGFRDIVLK